MQKDSHFFKGLSRNTHQIRQDKEFLWDALNVRIIDAENNTTFSITNEKGTAKVNFDFGSDSKYCGHSVVDKYLVLFMLNNDTISIYRVEEQSEGKYTILHLFKGLKDFAAKLKDESNPLIQTASIFESDSVKKVYWMHPFTTVGVINVALPEKKISKDLLTNGTSLFPPYPQDSKLESIIPDGLYKENLLKLSPDIVNISGEVEVNPEGTGSFSPGTIQYLISVFNKQGQEKIWYVTPLYMVSFDDRAGSPEETISRGFKIDISKFASDFDYLRIYSIHRTSLDSEPEVKVVKEVVKSSSITVFDTGTIGYVVDPTLLLYIGGENVSASTGTIYKNTLFLGNVGKLTLSAVPSPAENQYQFIEDSIKLPSPLGEYYMPHRCDKPYYYYPNTAKPNLIFKTGEIYKCGIQMQYKDGTWGNPIFLKNEKLSGKYPYSEGVYSGGEYAFSKIVKLGEDYVDTLRKSNVAKVRTCIIKPSVQSRTVLCQGILCPTVYNYDSRNKKKGIYAMSSWFFRPHWRKPLSEEETQWAIVSHIHNYSLYTANDRGAEIQSMLPGYPDIETLRKGWTSDLSAHYLVDENVVTFHSPDIELDENLSNVDWKKYSLKIIGTVNLLGLSSDREFTTSSDQKGRFEKCDIGYNISAKESRGIRAMVPEWMNNRYYAIYPFQRGTGRTNILSNLSFYGTPTYEEIETIYPESCKLCDSDKIEITIGGQKRIYAGNGDTIAIGGKYFIWSATTQESTIENYNGESSSDPVHIKYSSAPHLVISLGLKNGSKQVLPAHVGFNIEDVNENEVTLPDEISNAREIGLISSGTLELDPPDHMLGCIGIGNYGNSNLGYIAEYVNGVDGKKWYPLPANSITTIGKFIKYDEDRNLHYTFRTGSMSPPFGTKEEDWSNPSPGYTSCYYIGNDKYIKFTKSSPSNDIISWEPISPQIPSSLAGIPSRSTFGKRGDLNTFYPQLLLAELIKVESNDSPPDISDTWIPSGPPVSIDKDSRELRVPYEYGDTWFSRYDCLKTYPTSEEDTNQIVEIASFPVETRINIDGRYDKNRGRTSNLYMSPKNFNLINKAYSQLNNFFSYSVRDNEEEQNQFSNGVVWSKTMEYGEDIDSFSTIGFSNFMRVGDKPIVKLFNFTGNIWAISTSGLYRLNYDSRVQIPVSDGVPIEIANAGKMDGFTEIGEQLKGDKVAVSRKCLYIGYGNKVVQFDGSQWKSINSEAMLNVNESIVGIFVDNVKDEVFLSIASDGEVTHLLGYSEASSQFTSFYSYSRCKDLFNFNMKTLSTPDSSLYIHREGKYNEFYGELKPWYFSFISNDYPNATKIFDNVEIIGDLYDNTSTHTKDCPINFIKVDNEYQHGHANAQGARQKFRIWRIGVPRNGNSRQRIRNPWAEITLGYNPDTNSDTNVKSIIHNVSCLYTV